MGGTELPGASMQVRNSAGEIVEAWTSSVTPHRINRLVPGGYVLHEEAPAAGYTVATDIPFTVTATDVLCSEKMTDKKVIVRKTDVMGQEVPGATLAVYELHDHDGESYVSDTPVDQWVSTTKPHEVEGLIVGSSYRLTEVVAAEGYVLAQSVDFTVTDDGVDQTVVLVDKQQLVLKTDSGIHALAGAHLEVVDKESGKSVDRWVSGGEVHPVNGLQTGRTYVLVETKAPKGYVLAAPVEFTVTTDLSADDHPITLINKQVMITKSDVTGERELPGATLTVTAKTTGAVCDHWVSGDTPHPVSGLSVGETYLLTEETAPEGYVRTSETIEFTAADDFADQKIVMKDKQVRVTKAEIAGGPEIEGASLQVTIKDTGETVDTWVSAKTPHPVSGLVTGHTYVLTEVIPAPGYATASSITFEVKNDGTDTEMIMEDAPTQLRISKKDLVAGGNSEELPGAKMEIRDADGNVIDQWISGKKPHEIERIPVGLYTLTEITAPDGYETAETIAFEVKDTGKIQSVTMYDAPFREVEISKRAIVNGKGGEELPGAQMSLKDEKGKVIEHWTSGKKPHTLKLESGTYTLTEVTAPAGYATAESVTFQVKKCSRGDYKVTKVEMHDAPLKVQISKTDLTNGKPVPGAVLEVRDSKGKVIEKWTTTKKPHMIERLPVGKYTLTEITAPKGYEVAETVPFEVKDTGEIQKVEMKDKPLEDLPGEKDGNGEKKSGEGEKEKQPETGKTGGGTSAGQTAPRTGDDTDPVGPVTAALLSLLVILGILLHRRVKNTAE